LNFINRTYYSFFNSFLWRTRSVWLRVFQRTYQDTSRTVLIVKIDEIGDYILFRNFIAEIKESYPEHQIALIGNIAWKDLFYLLDESLVDTSLFIDKQLYFSKHISSRYKALRFIYKLKTELIIQPSYSRNKTENDLLQFSGAPIKIGYKSDGMNLNSKQMEHENKYFTQLVLTSANIKFEFTRNKHFFESFLKKKIDFNIPSIQLPKTNYPKSIVISPGAGNPSRMWSQENFSELCSLLISLDFDITLVGSILEWEIGDTIERKIESVKLTNLIGKTKLNELPQIIDSAQLVVCNDSSVLHLSAALNKRVICISNGNHLNRFIPYPKEYTNIHVIFPPEIDLDHPEKYQVKSDIDINTISVDRVLLKIKEVINA
jgi:ADP-heptose:LPS heptosyltransferase